MLRASLLLLLAAACGSSSTGNTAGSAGSGGSAGSSGSAGSGSTPTSYPQLPPAPVTDPVKVAKGRELFERVMGRDSCATCHADKPGRAVPSLWNVASFVAYGRDGHAKTLEDITREMLRDFEGIKAIDETEVAALAEFTRARVCRDTAYDRFAGGDRSALDDAQQRGLALFVGKAACNTCHAVPHFSTAMKGVGIYYNTGVGTDVLPDSVVGRHIVTKNDRDWAAIKPPSLRDVARTAPYMHDGSIATLAEAVKMMATGGIANRNRHAEMIDRGLSAAELADVEAFMHALDCTH